MKKLGPLQQEILVALSITKTPLSLQMLRGCVNGDPGCVQNAINKLHELKAVTCTVQTDHSPSRRPRKMWALADSVVIVKKADGSYLGFGEAA